ncbi:MAG: hypothetical protein F6K26_45630, partial [Moorea sp. SIO2I5]|nr:hypothetical protein [Moorena sp. SIO2I5]
REWGKPRQVGAASLEFVNTLTSIGTIDNFLQLLTTERVGSRESGVGSRLQG